MQVLKDAHCTIKVSGQAEGVLHIHLEFVPRAPNMPPEDVITKAHVKESHFGDKLFDLDLKWDTKATMILQQAYGVYSIYV